MDYSLVCGVSDHLLRVLTRPILRHLQVDSQNNELVVGIVGMFFFITILV